MKLLKNFIAKLTFAARPDVLFQEKPMLQFYPEIQNCPDCSSMLHVQKTTDPKTAVTMDIGAFFAKETVLYCPHGHGTFRSEQLRNLVPKGGTFGFDVIIEVGFSLFVHCRSNQEVMADLATKNVFISDREVSFLGRKFIIYLALAHRQIQPVLREFFTAKGGYILHVDGTFMVQPQRTNNILEIFFRDVKRRGRKKTGMGSLNKMLKTILADTPLLQNLKNDKYVEIILNGCSTLAERFSQIDADLVQKELITAAKSNGKILPGIKKMIRDAELTVKISTLFCSAEAK